MSFRVLKWICVMVPPIIIGGFELIRHDFLLDHLSMETGNWLIIVMTFVLSYLFSTWMFGEIEKMNLKLAEERSKSAVLEERERMARQLHDQIAQTMFFLNVNLKQGKIEEAREAVREIDNHVRQAIFNLRSEPENQSTLAERIKKWVLEWREISGIQVKMKIQVPEGYFTEAEEVIIFSIIQEAFANIRKHSLASVAELSIMEEQDGWSLFVEDDGMGLPDPVEIRLEGNDSTLTGNGKYGLQFMYKQSRELGAEQFMFQNRSPHGIRLGFSVPSNQRKRKIG